MPPPFPLAEAAPPPLPSRLREGSGEGLPARRALAKPPGRWPPPGLPRKRGRRRFLQRRPLPYCSPPACGRGWGRVLRRVQDGLWPGSFRRAPLLLAVAAPSSPYRTAAVLLPASPASGGGEDLQRQPLPFRSPPACGRGWGRAFRSVQDGPCPVAFRRAPPPLAVTAPSSPCRPAAGPHPASPASGGGEETRRPFRCPFPACRGCPAAAPLPLAGGVGGGSLGAMGLYQAARPPAPTRPPRKRGRGRIIAAAAALVLPSRLREGLGEGLAARAERLLPVVIAAHSPGLLPASPASGGGEDLWRRPLPYCSPPACGRDWGRVLRRDGLLPGHPAAGPHPASPASGGGEDLQWQPLPSYSPPACGRGWGRVSRREGAFRAARPLAPIRPPPRAGEEKICSGRRFLPTSLPLAGGVGGGSLGATGLCRSARPLAPTRPPPRAGEEKICGDGRFLTAPLPLAGGIGGGSFGAMGFCRATRPLAPTRPPPQAGEGKICSGGSFLTAPLPLAGGVGGGACGGRRLLRGQFCATQRFQRSVSSSW